jgi:DNA invertase Pin-like site-specific DNA recombinase
MNNEIIGIGYVRVSTKKQADEGVSLEVQKRDVEKKLRDLGCTKIHMYEDEGKSGKSIEGRDDFQKAVEKALKHKAKYFCTYDTSRFARNTEEAIAVVRKLQKQNIELICVTAKFDDTPEGRLVFRMLASIDEYYSDSLGAKIKVSLQKKREQGYFMGKAPKGYDNIRVNNKADIILNDDGRAIQKTLKNYLAGRVETLREVAKDLDRNGFEPHKETSFQTAGRILKNPFYAGMFWDNTIDNYRDHVYEKLISKDNWFFIQEKMHGRQRQTNHYKKHHPSYPLRSVTYCSKCGRKLRGYPSKGNGGVYPIYACPTKGCSPSVRTSVLHNQFEETISSLEPDEGLLKLFEEILRRSLSQGLSIDSEKDKILHRRTKIYT